MYSVILRTCIPGLSVCHTITSENCVMLPYLQALVVSRTYHGMTSNPIFLKILSMFDGHLRIYTDESKDDATVIAASITDDKAVVWRHIHRCNRSTYFTANARYSRHNRALGQLSCNPLRPPVLSVIVQIITQRNLFPFDLVQPLFGYIALLIRLIKPSLTP